MKTLRATEAQLQKTEEDLRVVLMFRGDQQLKELENKKNKDALEVARSQLGAMENSLTERKYLVCL